MPSRPPRSRDAASSGGDAATPEARVDLEVHLQRRRPASRRGGRLGGLGRRGEDRRRRLAGADAERDRASKGLGDAVGRGRVQDEEREPDPGLAELERLVQRGDREAVRRRRPRAPARPRRRRARRRRPSRRARRGRPARRRLAERGEVPDERVEVDLDPRRAQRAAAGPRGRGGPRSARAGSRRRSAARPGRAGLRLRRRGPRAWPANRRRRRHARRRRPGAAPRPVP